MKLQDYIKEFSDIECANMFLREKVGMRIRKFPLSTGNLYSYEVPEFKSFFLDPSAEIVYAGRRNYPVFRREYVTGICWQEAFLEEALSGISVLIYNYNGSIFMGTPESPSGEALVPGKVINYSLMVKRVLVRALKKRAIKNEKNTISKCVELFKPDLFYHMLYIPKEEELYLISVVKKDGLRELPYQELRQIAASLGVLLPRTKKLTSNTLFEQVAGSWVLKTTEKLYRENIPEASNKKIYLRDNHSRFKIV